MHVIRMSHYTRLLAESFCNNIQWTNLLFNASPMHDIGKIGIPDRILQKPGKLESDEWDIMKKHPMYGAQIIGEHSSKIMAMARDVALTHHEKWDGKGYPNGLKEDDIPLSGRIVAIADVFDALTTARPYKNAWSVEDAVNLINEENGKHFDPNLVLIFNEVLPLILDIKEMYSEEKAQVWN